MDTQHETKERISFSKLKITRKHLFLLCAIVGIGLINVSVFMLHSKVCHLSQLHVATSSTIYSSHFHDCFMNRQKSYPIATS